MEEYRAAGDKVVVIVRQRGRAKATGLPVDMHFGQVWTYRDGKQLRMEMYATPEEALDARPRRSREPPDSRRRPSRVKAAERRRAALS